MAQAQPALAEPDLASLFDEHVRVLLRVAARVAGHGAHVEDIVQETFVVATRRWGEVELTSPRAWLCGVCANVARHHSRSAGRRRRLGDACRAEATLAEKGPRPDVTAQKRARAWRVRAAVAELPEDQRVAVVLNLFEGVTCAEIARVLELSPKTVESRVRLGRAKIAAAVEDLA